jgi:hypothetical protein
MLPLHNYIWTPCRSQLHSNAKDLENYRPLIGKLRLNAID